LGNQSGSFSEKTTAAYAHSQLVLTTTDIARPDDPRVAPFAELQDRELQRDGLFIAEGENLVRRLADSRHTTDRVLVARSKVGRIADMDLRCPVYVIEDRLLSELVGFRFHQGVLAAGRAAEYLRISELPAGPVTLVYCPEIHNGENLGAIIRVAAALGADGLLLGPRCHSPFFRQTIRVSMGNVFRLPLYRCEDDAAALGQLAAAGVQTVATVCPDEQTVRQFRPVGLEEFVWKPRCAVMLGSEGHGLGAELVALAGERLTIPMDLGTDSLNVSVAAALILYQRRLALDGGGGRGG
jgi:tRNA G18 (ribose-2'-O)-methylase SpoU